MIKVRGFNIENQVYNNFLEWLQRKSLKEELLSKEEFKNLLQEFKGINKEGLK